METKTFFAGNRTINGIDVYYEHFDHPSSKHTVVLLHGYLSSLFSFRHLVPLLKKEYSVVSIDLPPFGKSGHARRYQYSYKNLANTVVKLMDSLRIKHFNLIGHSMGGQIALNILYHFPGRALRAALLCSSGYLDRAKQSLIAASYLPFFHVIIKYHLARSGIEKNLKSVVYDHSLIDAEMRQGYMSPFNDNRIFKGLKGLLRHREGDLSSEALTQIQTPCLLIWGRQDKVVPLSVGTRLHHDLPNSEFMVFDHTGHLVPEERPNEVFQHIKQFLETDGKEK